MAPKQRPPTPVRFSAEEELQIMKAARREGIKLSSWIKKVVRKELPKIKRVDEKDDQGRVV